MIIKWFIFLYRWTISPVIGPCCRFYPSCSQYMNEAVTKHGTWKGVRLGFKRILKCHPWNPGGYDPVP